MPMYDWECPDGHRFEHVVSIADRNKLIPCQVEGCTHVAERIEISHSNPGTMLEYGFGLNREALQKGTYDPLNPINRGIRYRKSEKV